MGPQLQHFEVSHVVSRLETLDIQSRERTVLAEFNHLIEAPNWTSDGKRMVYNSGGRLYEFDISTRRTAVIDTGYATKCNNDHVLSPDNAHVAVSHHGQEDGRSRIYVIPLAEGTPRLVTPLSPSYLHGWSPDGTTLVYCAQRNDEFDIYSIPTAGGTETRLTDAPGLDDGPEYSPDGSHIWFNSVRTGLMQIWRMSWDGTHQTQMTFDLNRNNWFPHVSPDGRHVVYISYRKGDVDPSAHPANKDVELRLMSTEGGDSQVLAELFGGQGTLNVNSWSPDSRKFAFVSYVKND